MLVFRSRMVVVGAWSLGLGPPRAIWQSVNIFPFLCVSGMLLRNLAVEFVDLNREVVGLGIWAAGPPGGILADGSKLQLSVSKCGRGKCVTYALGNCIGYTSKDLQCMSDRPLLHQDLRALSSPSLAYRKVLTALVIIVVRTVAHQQLLSQPNQCILKLTRPLRVIGVELPDQ